MIRPEKAVNEAQRLQALYSLKILDSEAEERFNRITRIAQKLFNVPIALVTLVDKDRQWFKAKSGLEVSQTPRDISFCGHTILAEEIMIVEDALEDERFKDNPLVTSSPDIRFYLGCPLKVQGEFNIGTLCLIDRKSRKFNESDLKVIKDLAGMVEAEFTATHLSTIDDLTQISNRRGFLSIGQQIFKRCNQYDKNLSLLFFDLNKFKLINDNYGHEEGNKVLKIFSQQLLKNFRHSDLVARLGGDEFCVLCSGLSAQQLPNVIKRFQIKLNNAATNHPIGFSVGAIQFDRLKHNSINALIDAADKEMYENKRKTN